MMNPHKLISDNPLDNFQTAIEIELSTIPIYLYTYYSINRTPNQNKIIADLTNRLLDSGRYSPDEAAAEAQRVSVEIMVQANKAGAVIMSVAVEEMLHLALASNLKRSLVGMPKMTGLSPKAYPTPLPGHAPPRKDQKPLAIPLARLSLTQLGFFKMIELPERPEPKPGDESKGYDTIGEFYGWILKYIDKLDDSAFNTYKGLPQLEPKRGYYATNNVNTMYYDKDHKPVFVNADNEQKEAPGQKDDLVVINSKATARRAINIIVTQGEGRPKEPWQKIPQLGNLEPIAKEESHYEKFCELYDEIGKLERQMGELGVDLLSYFVKPVPENPTTAGYPRDVQAVSNLLNAVYTYLFMMTEACYRHPVPKQQEIFNFGMHKGMIFILSTLCDAITSLPLPWGGVAAPTFENYEFSPATSAKSQLIALYNQIPASANPNPNVLARISTLPDMDIVTGQMLSFA